MNAVITIVGIVVFVKVYLGATWKANFMASYYNKATPTGALKDCLLKFSEKYGVKSPAVIIPHYQEVMVANVPASFLTTFRAVTNPANTLAEVWYFEPAFGMDNQDCYLVDLYLKPQSPVDHVRFANGKTINTTFITNGLLAADYGGNKGAAVVMTEPSAWHFAKLANDSGGLPTGKLELRVSYYQGAHAGGSYFVIQ